MTHVTPMTRLARQRCHAHGCGARGLGRPRAKEKACSRGEVPTSTPRRCANSPTGAEALTGRLRRLLLFDLGEGELGEIFLGALEVPGVPREEHQGAGVIVGQAGAVLVFE